MNETLKIILSLSLSGTLLFFIILALKPLYKNKLSRSWQYYVWLIVIVRMLLPFTPETTLVGSTFAYFENINVEITQSVPPVQNEQSDLGSDDATSLFSMGAVFSKVHENLWILWAAIAFALLVRKITMYQSFVRFVKAGWSEVADIQILNMLADIGETVGVKRPVELFINPLISSPMLLGFFRPYIILPSIELESTELAYIMRHELTHYKHLDMFYKWLVQVNVCLHWFNPFAYLLAKEINKCCELSCDEAIIRTLDQDEKKAYGDTLLNSLKAFGNYNDKLATVTLTESAEQLKERLDAIIKFQKKSKAVIIATLVLTTMLCIGATAVGAYVTSSQIDEESKTKLQEIDGLNSYGYVGAGYMNVDRDGVEDIYNKYKKYGMVRSDKDGSLSYEGQRVREFVNLDEGWRYFDDIGTIDLHFNKDENKLEVASQQEYDERSLILAEYDNYCISQDMTEESPVEEELKEE